MINEKVKILDDIFSKYSIKDDKNVLGYKDNFIQFVKSLENVKLEDEYNKKGLLYEIVELQRQVGWDIDLLNYYTMIVATSNRHLGQDFTPNSLSELLSKLVVTDVEYPTFYDAAGGTGSLVIQGYYKWLYKQKTFDSQFKAILEVDEYDVYNCYCCVFNFIIRGVNAVVRNINTLTNEVFKVWIMTNGFTFNKKLRWFSDFKEIVGDEKYEY